MELISAIKQARGIIDESKDKGGDVREIKKLIAALKLEKLAAQEAGDKKRTDILRRKLSRLKKKTRRAA